MCVALSNPVLHHAQKEDLRQYQQMHQNTLSYSVFCNAAANQVDTDHLQINLFHAKRKKAGWGGLTIYIYIYIIWYPSVYTMALLQPRKGRSVRNIILDHRHKKAPNKRAHRVGEGGEETNLHLYIIYIYINIFIYVRLIFHRQPIQRKSRWRTCFSPSLGPALHSHRAWP